MAAVMLTSEDVGYRFGIAAATWRRYVYKGTAPQPDEYVGRTPRWRESTVDRWARARPGRGVGGGRPRKTEG